MKVAKIQMIISLSPFHWWVAELNLTPTQWLYFNLSFDWFIQITARDNKFWPFNRCQVNFCHASTERQMAEYHSNFLEFHWSCWQLETFMCSEFYWYMQRWQFYWDLGHCFVAGEEFVDRVVAWNMSSHQPSLLLGDWDLACKMQVKVKVAAERHENLEKL